MQVRQLRVASGAVPRRLDCRRDRLHEGDRSLVDGVGPRRAETQDSVTAEGGEHATSQRPGLVRRGVAVVPHVEGGPDERLPGLPGHPGRNLDRPDVRFRVHVDGVRFEGTAAVVVPPERDVLHVEDVPDEWHDRVGNRRRLRVAQPPGRCVEPFERRLALAAVSLGLLAVGDVDDELHGPAIL